MKPISEEIVADDKLLPEGTPNVVKQIVQPFALLEHLIQSLVLLKHRVAALDPEVPEHLDELLSPSTHI